MMQQTMQSTCFYQLLLNQHRKTEQQLADLHRLVESADIDWAELRGKFDRFADELLIHYASEEHALFPVLSQYRTMMLMEVEHNNLLNAQYEFARELEESAKQGSATAGFKKAFANFEEKLKCHVFEEEGGIFSFAEQCFEPEEKALVQRKLEEVSRSLLSHEHRQELLSRPKPFYAIYPGKVLQAPDKPIIYEKLFEQEHASVYQIQLQSGQRLKTHMAGEHQAMIVVSGQTRFICQGQEEILTIGQMITLDPRLPFSVEAQADTVLLVFKVWPRPHFLRV